MSVLGQVFVLRVDPCHSIDSGVDYGHPNLGGGFGPGYKVIGGYDLVGSDFTGRRSAFIQIPRRAFDKLIHSDLQVATPHPTLTLSTPAMALDPI